MARPATPRRDSRSEAATLYRAWYKTKIWKAIRASQLASHPLCTMCEKAGRLTAATVCDHIKAHRGDWSLFVSGPFQSLCASCHSSTKQAYERTGIERKPIGIDGWPIE